MAKPHALVGIMLALLWAAPVHAQDDDAEARMLFEAGRVAFDEGEYERAHEHFERAYALSGRYPLLFNIGRSAEFARHDARAVEAYEQFLAEAPADHRTRPEVERRLDILRRALAERDAALHDAVEREAVRHQRTEPAAPEVAGEAVAAHVAVGSSSVVFAVGAILGVVALVHRDQVENAPDGVSWDEIRGPAESAPGESVAAIVLLAVGGAGLAASIVLYATHGSGGESVEARVGPGSLTVRGAF